MNYTEYSLVYNCNKAPTFDMYFSFYIYRLTFFLIYFLNNNLDTISCAPKYIRMYRFKSGRDVLVYKKKKSKDSVKVGQQNTTEHSLILDPSFRKFNFLFQGYLLRYITV